MTTDMENLVLDLGMQVRLERLEMRDPQYSDSSVISALIEEIRRLDNGGLKQ